MKQSQIFLLLGLAGAAIYYLYYKNLAATAAAAGYTTADAYAQGLADQAALNDANNYAANQAAATAPLFIGPIL